MSDRTLVFIETAIQNVLLIATGSGACGLAIRLLLMSLWR
jgi:hypothetical protein